MVGPARENRDMARYAAAPHPRVLFALVAALVLALAGCSGAGGAGGGSEGGSGGELDRNAALRAATWANDVARAEQLIAAGADVNAKDETQQSAYLITTSEGYDAILDLTLAHGARVDDLDSWNGTGLIRAAERGLVLREVALLPDGTLDAASLAAAIGPRTRLVAMGLASNALGTVTRHWCAPSAWRRKPDRRPTSCSSSSSSIRCRV